MKRIAHQVLHGLEVTPVAKQAEASRIIRIHPVTMNQQTLGHWSLTFIASPPGCVLVSAEISQETRNRPRLLPDFFVIFASYKQERSPPVGLRIRHAQAPSQWSIQGPQYGALLDPPRPWAVSAQGTGQRHPAPHHGAPLPWRDGEGTRWQGARWQMGWLKVMENLEASKLHW